MVLFELSVEMTPGSFPLGEGQGGLDFIEGDPADLGDF